ADRHGFIPRQSAWRQRDVWPCHDNRSANSQAHANVEQHGDENQSNKVTPGEGVSVTLIDLEDLPAPSHCALPLVSNEPNFLSEPSQRIVTERMQAGQTVWDVGGIQELSGLQEGHKKCNNEKHNLRGIRLGKHTTRP